MAKRDETNFVSKKAIVKNKKDLEQQKKLIIGAGATVVVALLVVLYGFLSQSIIPKMKPAAKVNNEKISVDDFVEYSTYLRYQTRQRYETNKTIFQIFGEDMNFASSYAEEMKSIYNQLSPEYAIYFGQSALDNMVDIELIRQKAVEMGISVSDAEIDEVMQKDFNYNVDEEVATATPFPTPLPTSTLSQEQLTLITIAPTATVPSTATETPDSPTVEPTVEAVETEPTAESTPYPTATEYTYEGYKKLYQETMDELDANGVNSSIYRDLVEVQLIVEKIQKELTKDISPVQTQVWARHILVSDKTAADVLYQQLTTGNADFGELAAEASIDPGSNINGGDLGWFPRGVMIQAFEDAAFDNLEVGEISEPVESEFGYHIIQKLGEEERSLSESQYTTLVSSAFSKWMEKSKEESDIVINDNWMQFSPVDFYISESELPASLRQ